MTWRPAGELLTSIEESRQERFERERKASLYRDRGPQPEEDGIGVWTTKRMVDDELKAEAKAEAEMPGFVHEAQSIYQRHGRWYVRCTCYWRSISQRSEGAARGALGRHVSSPVTPGSRYDHRDVP